MRESFRDAPPRRALPRFHGRAKPVLAQTYRHRAAAVVDLTEAQGVMLRTS
jgi:hypothetical protein